MYTQQKPAAQPRERTRTEIPDIKTMTDMQARFLPLTRVRLPHCVGATALILAASCMCGRRVAFRISGFPISATHVPHPASAPSARRSTPCGARVVLEDGGWQFFRDVQDHIGAHAASALPHACTS